MAKRICSCGETQEHLHGEFLRRDGTISDIYILAKADQVIDHVRKILDGIDRDGSEDDGGWWETSVGADFGAERLAALENYLRMILK